MLHCYLFVVVHKYEYNHVIISDSSLLARTELKHSYENARWKEIHATAKYRVRHLYKL